MKITKQRLKEIIKEELENSQNEGFFSRLGARLGIENKAFKPAIKNYKAAVDIAANVVLNSSNYSAKEISNAVEDMWVARGAYTKAMEKGTGADGFMWIQELNKEQKYQHNVVSKGMDKVLDELGSLEDDKIDSEAAAKKRQIEREREMERRREEEEMRSRRSTRAQQDRSSSSKKSGFDKWQSGEGDNYNYMTRMEEGKITKDALKSLIAEELANLKGKK